MTATDDAEALPTGASARRPRALTGERLTEFLGAAALLLVVLCGLALAAGAAAGTRFLSGSPRLFPGWVAGPLAGLGAAPLSPVGFAALVATMCLAYALALGLHRRIGLGGAVAAAVAAHATFALAPPIVTPDVFSYLAYARLGGVHGLSSYLNAPAAIPEDPVFDYVAFRDLPNPYGPLFTALVYPLASLDLPAGLWTLKGASAATSLACTALTAALARRRGREVVLAVLVVGLNPLVLLYAVGGAHNDHLLALLVLVGILLAANGREAAAGVAVVAATAIKVTGGLALPFLIAGARSRWRAFAGAAAATLAGAGAFVLAFGAAAPGGLVRSTEQQSRMVSELSVPYLIGWAIGHGGAGPGLRALGALAFLLIAAWLLYRTLRGHDWVDAAGWATIALLLATAWPMPYYLAWLVPLAALGSRRLLGATLALCLVVAVSRVTLVLL